MEDDFFLASGQRPDEEIVNKKQTIKERNKKSKKEKSNLSTNKKTERNKQRKQNTKEKK